MSYVEWLRVRGALKWTAIVLGVLWVLAVVARIGFGELQGNAMKWISDQERDPQTKHSDVVLPDGSHRVEIWNRRTGSHVTIIDRGWYGKDITIDDPSSSGHEHDRVTAGSIRVMTMPNGHGSTTIIHTGESTAFATYLPVGCVVALILATILGAPFARENDGHLEIALTKPASRESIALQTLAVDVAGILAGIGFGVVLAIASQLLFELPRITFGGSDAGALLVVALGAVAWYAMLTAATTSMRRGYGAIQGFAWPIALVVLALAYADISGNAMLATLHTVATWLNVINPLGYLQFRDNGDMVAAGSSFVQNSVAGKAAILAALCAAYGTLTVLQWRRVEA